MPFVGKKNIAMVQALMHKEEEVKNRSKTGRQLREEGWGAAALCLHVTRAFQTRSAFSGGQVAPRLRQDLGNKELRERELCAKSRDSRQPGGGQKSRGSNHEPRSNKPPVRIHIQSNSASQAGIMIGPTASLVSLGGFLGQ